MQRHTIAFFIAPGAFALFASLAAHAAPSTRGKQDPASIYHNYCSVCHGDRGDGRSRATASLSTPPRSFTTPEAARALTREGLFEVVKNGRPGTAMVGWKTQLNDEQIGALVSYIQETFLKPAASPLVQRGRSVYRTNCVSCHGDQGQGARPAGAATMRPPPDLRSPKAALDLTRERMIATVTHGKAGTAMAAFGKTLPNADIEAVVDFVRAAIMMPASPAISGTSAHGARPPAAAGADMSLPFPHKLSGDARKGRAFYLANCATCHGGTGDGKGPRAYFINPKPRVLTEAGARAQFNRPALYAAVADGRLGTEMPAWDKVLNAQEIANVAEFVFQEFIRPREARQARDGK